MSFRDKTNVTGELSCCPLVKMLRGRSQERRTAAQVHENNSKSANSFLFSKAAAVSSFLNRTFGKPLQDDAGNGEKSETSKCKVISSPQNAKIENSKFPNYGVYSSARACASSLDGSIYSTAEIKPPNNSDEDARFTPFFQYP